MHRDKVSNLYQFGITNAMEISRRTGKAKSTVYRTISKINTKISIKRKGSSGKGRVINKNDTISLVKLARNNRHMSIRKLTSKFNITRSNTYSRETVRQHLKRLDTPDKLPSLFPSSHRGIWTDAYLGQKITRPQIGRRSYSVTKCPFGHKGRFAYGAKVTNTQ